MMIIPIVLISKKGAINMKKKFLGQYFTEKDYWIYPDIVKLLENNNFTKILDPFAGSNNLIKNNIFNNIWYKEGYEIDPFYIKDEVLYNDSFHYIPNQKDCLIVTNPPYIYKSIAKKERNKKALKYFATNNYVDLYLLAIKNSLKSTRFSIFIVPETFLFLKNNPFMQNIVSLNIIEDRMFYNTDTPVLSVIFDNTKTDVDFKIFKNGKYLFNYNHLETIKNKLKKDKNIPIIFNDISGQILIKGIDGIKVDDKIEFKKYTIDDKILVKESSRHHTVVKIDYYIPDLDLFIVKLNKELNKLREETKDLILSPFKGNNKAGIRRRRLSFDISRKLIIEVLKKGGANNERKDNL